MGGLVSRVLAGSRCRHQRDPQGGGDSSIPITSLGAGRRDVPKQSSALHVPAGGEGAGSTWRLLSA